jgi:N-acetyl-anhydromuramyl-L-alanine amidase AmpD
MTDNPMARRAVLRGGMGLALAGSLGVLRGLPADAVTAPTIYGTSAWGARPPSSPITVLDWRPTMVIVHHTAGANSTDYSLSHAFSLARAIQDYHMDHNGWIDSGQQFTISRGGYIMEGRHRSLEVLTGGTRHVRGAHTSGQNDYAVGIENEGTYITASPTTALWNSLVNQVAYICQKYAISPSRIFGHRDYNNTECPGDKLYSMLPQLRDQVAAKLGLPNPPDPIEWPLTRNGDTGERVRSVQYLLRQFGRTEVAADGIFGSITETAVRAFQSSRGLSVDGMVGSETWPALIVTVRNGNTGEAVRGVQSQLRAHGYMVTVDGVFGSQTETAVRAFQSSRGLTVDGIVGPVTWQYLVN